MIKWIAISLYIFFALVITQKSMAQSGTPFIVRHPVITTQYAGSTGFLSIGYSIRPITQRFEFGLMYGRTPMFAGGPLSTISFKALYNPISIRIGNRIAFDPIQTGFFLAHNYGRQISKDWAEKYPSDYYWWSNGIRQHIFLGSQIGVRPASQKIEKISLFIEANTNDLYLVSYHSNQEALKFTDILFLGAGVKVYFK